MDLRTFSVKQPWAGLLMAGVKRFEVRTWRPKEDQIYAMVHASSGRAVGLPEFRRDELYQKAVRAAGMVDEKSWTQSALLGLVEIKKVWERGNVPPGISDLDEYLCGTVHDIFLWEVGGRWPFTTPIKCHGRLNLWRVGQELYDQVNSQLSGVDAPVRIGPN